MVGWNGNTCSRKSALEGLKISNQAHSMQLLRVKQLSVQASTYSLQVHRSRLLIFYSPDECEGTFNDWCIVQS